MHQNTQLTLFLLLLSKKQNASLISDQKPQTHREISSIQQNRREEEEGNIAIALLLLVSK
jgi:hypothetical protein